MPFGTGLRRKRGETAFDQIVCGTVDDLVTCSSCLTGMLSDNLRSQIEVTADDEQDDKSDSESTKPTEQESN